ncbi:MAG: cell division protein FtsZ, partial [Patescibacteria group bacterium]
KPKKIKKTQKRIAVKKRKKVLVKRRKKAVKTVKKVLHKKIEKPAEKEIISPFSAESFFKAKIKVVGVGGGGGSIVSEIGRSLEKATFVIADTDARALKKRAGIKYFCFGQNLTHGLGTGVNVELARRAAEQDKDKISGIFKDQDIVIFIASLGGGLGSGATKVFAEAAKTFGGITLGIFTLPFKFEGKTKTRIALKALKDLRSSLNVSITIPNEKIFKIIGSQTSITQAFSIVNKNLIESLESLIDLIYNPGLINIDFADLRAILKGRGNFAFLNTIESSGKNRAEDIAKKILFNPLYQNNNFTAGNILFNISGSQNLSMFEVEKISKDIAQMNPSAKIIFGISKDAKLKNKIKATLLMTGLGNRSEPVKEEEIKPAEVKKVPKKKKKAPVVTSIPIFDKSPQREAVTVAEKSASAVFETVDVKKTIRRNALEIKKALEDEEQKRQLQEKEWEIPAFLRKVKFKS